MTINLQQSIAFLPLFILILTIAIVILSISYNRDHFYVSILSSLGFIFSFFSLYFLIKIVPIDITVLFHIDKYSILYMIMILISAISTCIFAYPWLETYAFNKEEFYLLVLFSTLGAMGLIISNNMSSLFINIELLSLPIFGLIAYSHFERHSLEASFKYIILSGVSSSFLLLGIAWFYSISGNLSFTSMDHIFNIISLDEKLVILFGIFMILLSLFFKLSIVPFHLWTPDIYQGTPAVVLSFFSTVGKISIFSILFHLFSYISNYHNKVLYLILSFMICFSMLFGNLMALFQNNIKRFFGYLSISQLGYLLIVLLSLNNNYSFSLETSGIYLCGYLFSNIAYFGIINLISYVNKENQYDSISSYQGLFWSQPILSSILTIVLLSLAGIPMTLGFIGKFYVLSIILKEHLWVIGVSFLIGTVLGLYCYLRMIINLYLVPSMLLKNNLDIPRYWFITPSGIIICISGVLLLILGIYPSPLISLF